MQCFAKSGWVGWTPSPGRHALAAILALIGLLLLAGSLVLGGADWPAAPIRFPVAVSAAMIGANVNESDALVALQSWRDITAKQSGFSFEFHISKLPNLVREVGEHQLEGYMVTALEFLAVETYSSHDLMTDESNAKGGDDYLLLTHQDSPLHTVAQLRGKSLNVHDNPRMCLASMWLDNLLASSKCAVPEQFFGRMSLQNKLSRVVLPVFFHQVDACLITRRGFNTMCELNPQLARKLRVIANSPLLVTTIIAFHKDCPSERRKTYETAMLELQKRPAGQQTLTLFESSRLVVVDTSILRTVKELASEHDRIHRK